MLDSAHKRTAMVQEKDEGIRRTVTLPQAVWDVVYADADRARRSASKQIEAILVVYYGLEGADNLPDIRGAKRSVDDEILALSIQHIITDLYGGVTPADANKFKRLAKQLGDDRAQEVADFDAAKKNSQKREPA